VDRCALFVDAGYALADGAMVVHGTRRRDSVSWNHPGLLTLLAGLAKDRTGLPVLRCYWYEVAADGRRTPEQDALAEMPGLKLRLVNSRPGRREGIDSQMRRDLVTLAKSGAISDAFIASADEHLAEIVAEVQDLGLRVVVLHISADGAWTIPQQLRQECDDIVEISGVHLRPFVELIRGAEPAMAIEAYPGPAESRMAGDLATLAGGAPQQISAEHAVPAAAAPVPLSAASGYPAVPGSVPPGQPVNPSIPAHPAGAVPASASPDSVRAAYSEPGGIVPSVGAGIQAPQQGHSQTLPYDRAQHYPAASSPPSPAPAAASYANGFDGPGSDPLGPAPSYGAGQAQGLGSAMPPADRAWPAAMPGDYRAGQDAGAYRGGGQNGALPTNGAYPATGGHNGTGQNGAVRVGPAQNGPAQNGPAQRNGVQNAPALGISGTQNGPGMNGGAPTGAAGTGGLNWGAGTVGQQPAARYEAMPGYQQQVPGGRDAGFGQAPAPGPGPSPGQGAYAQAQPGPPPHPHVQQGPPPPHAQAQLGPPPHAQVQQASLQHGPPSQPGASLAYQDHYAVAQPPLAQPPPGRPMQQALPLPDAVKAAHAEGFSFGESVGRDAPGLWLEAVLARKPRMPSDLEARLLQGSTLPIDSLLHDEVRHSLRRGFWDALEVARR